MSFTLRSYVKTTQLRESELKLPQLSPLPHTNGLSHCTHTTHCITHFLSWLVYRSRSDRASVYIAPDPSQIFSSSLLCYTGLHSTGHPLHYLKSKIYCTQSQKVQNISITSPRSFETISRYYHSKLRSVNSQGTTADICGSIPVKHFAVTHERPLSFHVSEILRAIHYGWKVWHEEVQGLEETQQGTEEEGYGKARCCHR